MEPIYLGDAVYINQITGCDWELYTFDGITKTNVIILDSETGYSLMKYLRKAFAED